MKLLPLFLLAVTPVIATPCLGQDGQSPAPKPALGTTAPLAVIPEPHIAEPRDSPLPIAAEIETPDAFPPAIVLQQSEQSSGDSSSAADINADTAGHEVEAFFGTGISVDGFFPGRPILNAGGRFGWMLTERHSDHFYDGRFEYGVEVAPLFILSQPGGAAYGFNFYAFVLKWNFAPHGHIAPFVEITGGAVVSNKQIPPGVSRFNFTPTGTIGFRILRGKYAWSIGARWFHVSDADITQVNPGNDTVGIRVSFSRWLK